MVDLAFLLIPGSGLIGPGFSMAKSTVQVSAGVLQAGVQTSAVWGYITTVFSVAESSKGSTTAVLIWGEWAVEVLSNIERRWCWSGRRWAGPAFPKGGQTMRSPHSLAVCSLPAVPGSMGVQ
jgi:hypothetical protein